jgi:predicted dehydrogenase
MAFHAVELRRHPGFQLVGAVDPLPDRRAEASREWAVPTGAELAPLLESTQADVAVIASPTPFHCSHARMAFDHGAHVLCEKPVACSTSELDEMLASAKHAGRRFLAYQQYRLKPELRALKSVLDQRKLGPIHHIKRAHCNYARRNDWQAFRANGGGLLNNYASHFLDEAMALLDNEPIASVYCQTRCVAAAGDAEDCVKIILVTQSGCIVDFDISQASAQPVVPWQVFGAHGAATWSAEHRVWQVRYYRPEEAPAVTAQQGFAAEGRRYPQENLPWREQEVRGDDFGSFDYYDLAWRYFAKGEPPPVAPEESRQLLQLIERCRMSAATGKVA